jgi:hypothetical protein
MTIVSTGTDGGGEELGGADGPDGEADGEPEGDGDADGAGVSSDGPGSIDGASVGGTVGTWPRLPEFEHAAVAIRRPDRARAGSRCRFGMTVMSVGSRCGMTAPMLDPSCRRPIAGT